MSAFATFLASLEQRCGAEAAEVRHELFFQKANKARAVAALVRDAMLLARQAGPSLPAGRRLAVLVATLPGASGWGTLERGLAAVRAAGRTPVILAHPRLDRALFPEAIAVCRPGGAGLGDVVAMAKAGFSDISVGTAIARRRLWRDCLARLLGPCRGILVLHNDFDMMSASALNLGWPSICLQHGIPTDEFFPLRADCSVVWGAGARRAYVEAGAASATLIEDNLGRAPAAIARERGAPDGMAPDGMAMISQTHATIFGHALGARLRDFAAALGRLAPGVRVLLHPGEARQNPYGGIDGLEPCLPPHDLLRGHGGRPKLVLGYCSTAMIEAACAGHWVAGIELGLSGNNAARALAVPPLRVGSAAEAVALYQSLTEDAAFRNAAAAVTGAWLADSLGASTGAFEERLRGEGV